MKVIICFFKIVFWRLFNYVKIIVINPLPFKTFINCLSVVRPSTRNTVENTIDTVSELQIVYEGYKKLQDRKK